MLFIGSDKNNIILIDFQFASSVDIVEEKKENETNRERYLRLVTDEYIDNN